MDSIEKVETTTEVTSLWEDYQNGLSYQQFRSRQEPSEVRQVLRGRPMGSAHKNTKNLPRPVVNIIKMICRNKKSAILSVPVKIIYRAEDDMADVEKFNRFADYIQKELGQDALDKKAIRRRREEGFVLLPLLGFRSQRQGRNQGRRSPLRDYRPS